MKNIQQENSLGPKKTFLVIGIVGEFKSNLKDIYNKNYFSRILNGIC